MILGMILSGTNRIPTPRRALGPSLSLCPTLLPPLWSFPPPVPPPVPTLRPLPSVNHVLHPPVPPPFLPALLLPLPPTLLPCGANSTPSTGSPSPKPGLHPSPSLHHNPNLSLHPARPLPPPRPPQTHLMVLQLSHQLSFTNQPCSLPSPSSTSAVVTPSLALKTPPSSPSFSRTPMASSSRVTPER